jgi:hypothetical protein
MYESEKEINTGNRVFWGEKHCIFVESEGKGLSFKFREWKGGRDG